MRIKHGSTTSADRDRGLRQRLSDLRAELAALSKVFVAREPIMRGSVYELRTKCGKPSCRCASGAERHSCMVISWTARGRKRLRSIPKEQQAELVALTERYRHFRKTRARVLEVQAKMLAIIDKLETARRKEP
jgi:hypothetical protein